MVESIGDLVALFLGLIVIWLIPGRLSGEKRPRRPQALQRGLKAR
jgi:hypothetical protein